MLFSSVPSILMKSVFAWPAAFSTQVKRLREITLPLQVSNVSRCTIAVHEATRTVFRGCKQTRVQRINQGGPTETRIRVG